MEKERVKNVHAVALGKLCGLVGGPARAAALTPAQRSKIASNAAKVRHAKARRLQELRRLPKGV